MRFCTPALSQPQPELASQQRRAFWLHHLHQWHWISSALCLIAMLLFAVTGITLNHSAQIEAHPVLTNKHAQLPPALLQTLLQSQVAQPDATTSAISAAAPLPPPLRSWIQRNLDLAVGEQAAEWSEQEVYLALPRPGGDAWLRIALDSGELEYEKTERGWIAYLNDLHKGRNTGSAWSWFLDAFAIACLIFCLTGLFLLQLHAGKRRATWPVLAMGLVLPLLLAIVFIH
jgi:hypothetical protein